MTKRSWVLNPPLKRLFSPHHSFGSKVWSKRYTEVCSYFVWIFACAVILLMGGLTLRMVGIKKTIYITNDEHETC
jgi:hypothetical protein